MDTPSTRAPSAARSREAVCRFVRGATWSALPAPTQAKAQLALLDNLAALLAGARWPSSSIAARTALDLYAPGHALLVADARRGSAAAAAFANCVAANAVDLDDVSVHTWGHPGAQVFPVALAFAEADPGTHGRAPRSGADLLTAMVVGYEIAFRIGRCMFADIEPGPERDYRGCGAWGAVAAAAVVARLQGLDDSALWHALGIAEYHAPWAPILEDIAHPAMVKHGHGAGAVAGVTAAHLAARGFTGTPSRLGQARFEARVADLGEAYLMAGRGIEWKEFACCLFAHPALVAVQQLRQTQPFTPEAVERIVIEAHHDARLLPTDLPDNSEAAQFNMAWCVAAFIADGELSPRQTTAGRLRDERLRGLCQRVEVRASADIDRLFWLGEANAEGGAEAVRVVVYLRDGRRLDSGLVEKPLVQDDIWDLARMQAKFRAAARDVLRPEDAEAVLAHATALPGLTDVREFSAVLHAALHRGDGDRASLGTLR